MKKKNAGHPQLNGIDSKKFLTDYWHKKPLLIRGAFPDFQEPVSPGELAGLSCEKGITSRIIIERGGKVPWEVLHGPFKKKTFAGLPKNRWTLLVNGVDRYVPEVHRLLDAFTFLPSWRIDDVMISYAADGGGVGAHVDNYDVFLIQAAGEREWQINTRPELEDDYIPDRAVRQLRKFKPNRTWVLQAGDMLYLPPRVPHNGIARGDGCMTYSIGFRAPSHAELLDSATTFALSRIDDKLRFGDADLRPQPHGEISSAAHDRGQQILRSSFLNREELIEWFGGLVTEPKDEDVEMPPERPLTVAELKKSLAAGARITRSEGSRLAYHDVSSRESMLFVNGRSYVLKGPTRPLGKLLTGQIRIPSRDMEQALASKPAAELVMELINSGVFYLQAG